MTGRIQDVALLVRKYARRHRSTDPELAEQLTALLRKTPTRGSPARRATPDALPLDSDSRVPLIRLVESPVLEAEPVYDDRTWSALRQVVRERKSPELLSQAGIEPTRAVLFTGPPGVGKTLAAKWIAREIGRPLAILDLAAVMSSFLGRTGSNLRAVIDFARDHECVLLLDELDAVAKRRDDTGEIGELKRLVTVLLQEIDEWPSTGLLLSATNHADLLDPAVWRRFEMVVPFPLPGATAVEVLLRDQLELPPESAWPGVLSRAMVGSSFSDAFQLAGHVRRISALERQDIATTAGQVLRGLVETLTRSQCGELALTLVEDGLVSQREASEITGVSRDTIRKHLSEKVKGDD